MTELDRPIKHLLREPHVAVDAMWQRIEGRRAGGAWRSGRARPSVVRHVGFAAAIGAAFGFALLAVTYTAPRVHRAWLERAAVEPLARANGEPLGELDTSATSGNGAALEVSLSDGSKLQLEPGSRLVTRHVEARQVRLAVLRGSVVFDVKPHGPRRWVIDAGDTQVEVLGTRFRVEYIAGRATVAVERGRVEVRGNRVPQGAHVLGAGERIVVVPTVASAGPSATRAPEARAASETVQPSPGAQSAPPAPAPQHDLVRQRAPRAPSKPGPVAPIASADPVAPPAAPTVTAAVLLQRADTARLSGEYTTAARALSQFLSEYPNDTRAPLVALTLGRLQLDRLGSARAAAASFALAERLGLPAAVAEAGAARLVEAYAKCGERELAVAAAARYRRRFPNGSRSANVAAWIDFD